MTRNIALLSLLGTTGCLYGVVQDAENTNELSGVTVLGIGQCVTGGCDGPSTHVEVTNVNGYYEFDPYTSGGSLDEENGVYLQPYEGKNAVGLLYLKSGYNYVFSFQAPQYVDRGNQIYTDELPDVFMTPSATAIDTDGDGMTDAEEWRLGETSPTRADTDGDGISDKLEVHGINYMSLKALGAHPNAQDLFVECDYMPGFEPSPTAMQDVVDRFAENGIALHLTIDDEITGSRVDFDIGDVDDVWVEFDRIKDVWFDRADTTVHHYCIFTQAHSGGNSTGRSRGIGGMDFIISLDGMMGDEVAETGTFLHELGHNLGLMHGGDQNKNCKPNYLSVMNYMFQLGGLRIDGVDVADYSSFTVADLDELDLDEGRGLDPGDIWTTENQLSRYQTRNALMCGTEVADQFEWTDRADRDIDWNRDGDLDGSVVANVNGNHVGGDSTGDDILEVLTSHNDWLFLDLSSSFAESGSGASPPQNDGQTLEDALAALEAQQHAATTHRRAGSTPQDPGALECAEVPGLARQARFTNPARARAWRAQHTPAAAMAWRSPVFGSGETP